MSLFLSTIEAAKMNTVRTCNECRQPKPLSQFHRGQYKCRRCANAVVNAYRKARRRTDGVFRARLNRFTSEWQRRNRGAQRTRSGRFFSRHKDRMTNSWLRSNIRRRFGPVAVTAEMLASARQRIHAVRSLRLARLTEFLHGNKT